MRLHPGLNTLDVILITSMTILSSDFARVRSANLINNADADGVVDAEAHHNGLPDGMGSSWSANNENDFFMDINVHDDKPIRSSGASERILSRKRRYLVFPEGSSLQVVYDAIIPIVDYTNYLILGITVALAWELPNKPPSEIIENFKEKLEEGTFGLSRNDTANKVQYVENTQRPIDYSSNANRQPVYYTSNLKQNYKYYAPTDYNYYSKPSKYSGYYANSKQPLNRGQYTQKVNPLTDWKKSSWWKSADRKSDVNRPQTKHQYKPDPYPKHRIYPVFGKRSISDGKKANKHRERRDIHLDKIDQIHLRHHRSTRHELYGKIEKYLHARGKNGQECVLKALCETGQKQQETEPGSFVGEIMRAIFTLPESHDSIVNHKHKLYDNAHSHDGDCSQRHPLCTDSIWSADFIF